MNQLHFSSISALCKIKKKSNQITRITSIKTNEVNENNGKCMLIRNVRATLFSHSFILFFRFVLCFLQQFFFILALI